MPDREKLITTLQYRINEARNKHTKVTTIFISTLSDCLDLLKLQEAVAIVWKFGFPHCPVCGQMLPEGDAVKYCLHCGKAVKLE